MIPLHLVIVSATDGELEGWNRTVTVPVTLMSNPSRRSLASIGNECIEALTYPYPIVIGLCHADTDFYDGALSSLTAAAMEGAVAGIVGIDLQRIYRWSKNNPGPVSTLDSCSVFFRRDLGLRFDEETFDGLHCHVEDLCLQAQARRIPVIVPAAHASHVGQSTDNPQWQNDYRVYRKRLAEKWRGVRFETT